MYTEEHVKAHLSRFVCLSHVPVPLQFLFCYECWSKHHILPLQQLRENHRQTLASLYTLVDDILSRDAPTELQSYLVVVVKGGGYQL